MKKMIQLMLILVISILMIGCGNTTSTDENVVEENVAEEIIEDMTEENVVEEGDAEEEEAETFGAFATVSTTGEEVTEAVFSDYDITMVNIWATWCSPCVNEMDELQEVYEGLDDNVNLISICYDGGSETDLANTILSENGVEFMALIPDSEIDANILSTLLYFPTTIFVDREGNIVGSRLEGAPSSNVVETYHAYIEEALVSIGIE